MSEIPERIARIQSLANNLYWAWTPRFRDLFKRLDHPAWVSTGHNPVRMLKTIPQERLVEKAQDPAFLKRYDGVMYSFDKYMEEINESWFSKNYPGFKGEIAYISTEYGLHQSLPVYSGGLGILAGDHVKESSDLGLPLIGIGFVYPQGYFKQIIPVNGWQKAKYENIKFEETPINPILNNGSKQLIIELDFPKSLFIRVWKLNVGRNSLFLMDTDIEENKPWDRGLSARLYGDATGTEMRIRQEIVLGFGSIKIISHLNHKPEIFHLNEGHTTFAALELIRKEMKEKRLNFDEAKESVRRKIIFTTHTPVPAGHDQFSFDLVSKYFQEYWEDLGITRDQFMSLGEFDWCKGEGSKFNMTALGIRLSRVQNAVSKLNAEVSNSIWERLYLSPEFKNRPLIKYVTNSVHILTWISGQFQRLYTKYLGKNWLEDHDNPDLWDRIDDIPDDELWKVRDSVRDVMFSFLRERARVKRAQEYKDSQQTLAAGALLDPHALTIGFARRFATYKRADLIFHDIERLKKSLLDPYTPIQIIFAGKAHPADDPGKHVLQKVYEKAIDPSIGGRICFIDDYDMQVARYLVQGVDIWLNTPLRPMEASGTSGMKSAINGGVNCSIIDGWWEEGYDGSNGYVIGNKEVYTNINDQNKVDSEAFYNILEKEIRPLFYLRDSEGIPEHWLEIVRNSIKTVAPKFSARRMLKEYIKLYIPKT